MINKKIICNIGLILIVSLMIAIYLFRGAGSSRDRDSEILPIGSVMAALQGKTDNNQGFGLLGIQNVDVSSYDETEVLNDVNNTGYEFEVYKSQIGLQGHILIMATKILKNGNAVVQLFKLINCFLFAFIILAISGEIYKRYGLNFAISFFLVSFSAHWNVDFSRNLYWLEYTWFIPLLLGLCLINYNKKKVFIYPLFFISILIKCLCGYEFISVVMMGGIVFLIAEWFRDKVNRKEYTKDIIIVGLMSVFGFVAAYLIHAYACGNGDIANGLSFMKTNLWGRRMSLMSSVVNGSDTILLESIKASVFSVLKMYMFAGLEGKLVSLFLFSAIICIIYQRKVLKRDNRFEMYLLVGMFLGAISWLVLAKPHSYIHTHINFVIWYMGFMQTCMYIVLNTLLEKKNIKLSIEKTE